MQLSALLGQAGFTAERLKTVAKVHLEKQGAGFAIPLIELELEGKVPGMSSADFQKHAETAKATCPVSKALGGVGTIMLSVKAV
jgi:osmotically inducible protein OsmC